MKRKLLTLVLALSMVVAYAMPVFNHGTESYAATSKTVEEAMTWVHNQVGVGIEVDGKYPYQCVDFIMKYYEILGVSHAWGNGGDYATNALPAGWTRVKGGTPKKGDILVYGYSQYSSTGHVAIYESDYVTYHQNYPSPYVTKYTNRKYNQLVAQFYWGYIRPNWKASAPAVTYTRYLSDDKYFIIKLGEKTLTSLSDGMNRPCIA